MKIQKIHIESFGGLTNRNFQFSQGLTVVEGPNESGKTTIAAFIKYIFYGFGTKNTTDRKRYLTGTMVGGWLDCITDEGSLYRIERVTRMGEGDALRDSVRIVDRNTNQILPETKPGEYFFGVAENIFVNTAFVGQIAGTRPDGTSLAGAVENMLHTADENINLKKAAEKLNLARRDLLPKNSDGGRIREKEAEKAALTELLAAAEEKRAKLIQAEADLADAKAKEAALAAKKEQQASSSEAAQVVSVCKNIASLEDTRKKLTGYQSTLDVLSSPPYADLQNNLRTCLQKMIKSEQTPKDGQLRIPDEEASAALEEGEFLESKARLFLAASITMLIAGITALAACGIMFYFTFPLQQCAIPLGVLILFAVVGIICYVQQNRTLNRLDALLDQWQVETLDELDALAEKGITSGAAFPAEDPMEELMALAQTCGVPVQEDKRATLAALVKKADKVEADRKLVQSKIENLRGRLAILEEQLEGVDRKEAIERYRVLAATPAGREALRMSADALSKGEQEKAFADSAWQAQCRKVAELEQLCASLSSTEGKGADILASQLSHVEKELTELQKRHDGYTMAYEALLQAGEAVRSGVIPEVTRKASSYMAHATEGKYSSVAMDPSFGMVYTKDSCTDSVELLSKGTADLAYISLRMALADTLFGENGHEVPPLLMDESFAAVDCSRLSGAVDAILSANLQCVLFTCRQDEASVAQKKGCAVISLM